MKKKTILPIAVTIVIFIIILANINLAELGQLFLTINPLYFAISMLFFIPIVFANALRWRMIISGGCRIGIGKSLRLTMIGLTFSAVTPSKLGDLTKAHYLKKDGSLNLKKGVTAVIVEKLLDLFSLSILLLAGVAIIGVLNPLSILLAVLALVFIAMSITFLAFFTRLGFLRRLLGFLLKRKTVEDMVTEGYDMLRELRSRKGRLASIFAASLLLWFLQVMQIYFFFLCFNYLPPLGLVMGLIPMVILIGLIPVTIAGMGTRESALIVLFLEYIPLMPVTLLLGVGLLISSRYWILAVAGLPFAKEYISRL